MKTIKHNGKTMHIGASEERAMRIVAHSGVAKRSEFEEGRGRYKRYILPTRRRMKELGMVEVYKDHTEYHGSRARKFFAGEGKRCYSAIFANTARINSILKKLEG